MNAVTERYDAVVVGARCAGSTLATLLARAGWRVLLLDRDRFPSDTVSTHMMFPDTLHRLDQLGIMQRLRAAHRISLVQFSWRVHGHEVVGDFTPVGGYDRGCCVRRITLDAAILDAARASGAAVRFGCAVTGLLGEGSADDPVRGVVLDTGERIESRWVFGADGRVSTVARRLGLAGDRERRGEMAFLLAYWRGLPHSDLCRLDIHEHAALMSAPCEDGIHLLSLAGKPTLTRGSAAERETRYREGLRQFPAVLNPRLLDRAERVSPLVVVPETMMRGHYRRAAGPGWALVGDAGHFKHPTTAQGIADAVEQAFHVASTLTGGGDLSDYERWRDDRAEEHYDWSYNLARFKSEHSAAHNAGLAADPAAGQEFLDLFTKRQRPSQVFTRERMVRWGAAWAYEDAQRRVRALVEDADDARLAAPVPACPDWTVRDLLAHLAGVAADSARGAFFPDAPDAWRDKGIAAARERWTADHVADRAGYGLERLLREFDDATRRLVAMLRHGSARAGAGRAWVTTAPVADLAVHLDDLGEAVGAAVDDRTPASRIAFAVYRNWLGARIADRGLPPLRLSDGQRDWILGGGPPAATGGLPEAADGPPAATGGPPAASVTAGRHELFRAISGRRSAAQIRGYTWDGDPAPYLPVMSPYPLPPDRPAHSAGALSKGWSS